MLSLDNLWLLQDRDIVEKIHIMRDYSGSPIGCVVIQQKSYADRRKVCRSVLLVLLTEPLIQIT